MSKAAKINIQCEWCDNTGIVHVPDLNEAPGIKKEVPCPHCTEGRNYKIFAQEAKKVGFKINIK